MDFTSSLPRMNLSRQANPNQNTQNAPASTTVASSDPQPVKRKVGRPVTKDIKGTCKSINVKIPRDLLNRWETIKAVHGSNFTDYVTKLISRDLAENYEKYKDLADKLKDI